VPQTQGAAVLLPWHVYYIATLTLYGLNILGAIFIHDVELITGFIGSVSCSILNFFLPGIYYVMTARKNNSLNPPTWKIICASIFAAYGLIMGLVCTVLRIVTLVEGGKEDL
jgi:hypothetical protein